MFCSPPLHIVLTPPTQLLASCKKNTREGWIRWARLNEAHARAGGGCEPPAAHASGMRLRLLCYSWLGLLSLAPGTVLC